MLNTKRTLFRLISFALVLAFAGGAAPGLQTLAAPAAMPISNQLAAKLVLGQSDFTTNTPAISQTGMSSPSGVAVDPTTGKVFVTEQTNNRVLRFASLTSLTNGAAAEAVLGQSDFTSNIAATTQNGMSQAFLGLCVDSAGRLWVTDYRSNRVLRFDNASAKANGANADGVLGQPNFTSATSNTTQNGMSSPEGLYVDGAGRLWVADVGNNRVLRFDNAAAKANGANADGVLGQPNFTTRNLNLTQSGMSSDTEVFVDTASRLWVVDFGNNRVLRFDNAAAKANGANADGVLGQTDFTTGALGTTQNKLSSPEGVSGDGTGRLYVADRNNNRILIFNNAAAKANGANADNVLGQPNFTSNAVNNGGLTARSLYAPNNLFYDAAADVLWVADWHNQRVLMYNGYVYVYFPLIANQVTSP